MATYVPDRMLRRGFPPADNGEIQIVHLVDKNCLQARYRLDGEEQVVEARDFGDLDEKLRQRARIYRMRARFMDLAGQLDMMWPIGG